MRCVCSRLYMCFFVYFSFALAQLADQAYMSPHRQAAAMRWFTIVTVLGVAGIPFVGWVWQHCAIVTST